MCEGGLGIVAFHAGGSMELLRNHRFWFVKPYVWPCNMYGFARLNRWY